MKFQQLHNWDLEPAEAIKFQKRLCRQVVIEPLAGSPEIIAGADIAIAGSQAVAGVVVYRLTKSKGLREIERKYIKAPLKFPYIPGLLTFREGPPLLSAFQEIRHRPDVILFDGQGIAHPRGLGLASHMGLILNVPTIGCAKSRLCGTHDEPGPNVGDFSSLWDEKGTVIGAVLRTRRDVKPIYVSVGHRIDLASSIAVVIACLDRTRIPKPTRDADKFVETISRTRVRCAK